MKSVYDMLKALDPELTNAQVDLAKTFNSSFAVKAATTVK